MLPNAGTAAPVALLLPNAGAAALVALLLPNAGTAVAVALLLPKSPPLVAFCVCAELPKTLLFVEPNDVEPKVDAAGTAFEPNPPKTGDVADVVVVLPNDPPKLGVVVVAMLLNDGAFDEPNGAAALAVVVGAPNENALAVNDGVAVTAGAVVTGAPNSKPPAFGAAKLNGEAVVVFGAESLKLESRSCVTFVRNKNGMCQKRSITCCR